tara:strand:- start:5898 stop:7001 length:1104 start_codon:yes stop_codon:yes gene_type:complete
MFLPIEFFSYLIVNKIKNHPFVLQSKYDFEKSKKKIYEYNNVDKDYVDLTPYFNELSEFENFITVNDTNNSFYTSINQFKKENNENILIQGDSWAQIANNKEIYDSLKDIAVKKKFGLYNSGRIGYSASPMKVQFYILKNKIDIKPSIIIAIMDQTDLGDELYRQQTLDKNTLALTSSFVNYKFKKNFFSILESNNFSFYKLLIIIKDFFVYKYLQFGKDFNKTINSIISRVIYLKDGIPIVISPLVYGLEKNERKIIQFRLNKYINSVFEKNDLKKLVIVTHPHKNHFANDEKKFKEDISLIVENTILNSKYKAKILHINFSSDFNNIYKDMELNEIFLKGDYASHLTVKNYLNYYYPYIFKKCCN